MVYEKSIWKNNLTSLVKLLLSREIPVSLCRHDEWIVQDDDNCQGLQVHNQPYVKIPKFTFTNLHPILRKSASRVS